jgi:hypothetical protein
MYWQKLKVKNVIYLWVETGNLREMEKIKRKCKAKSKQTKEIVSVFKGV